MSTPLRHALLRDVDPTGRSDWVSLGLLVRQLRPWRFGRREPWPRSDRESRALARRIVREYGTFALQFPSVRRAYVGPLDRLLGRAITTTIVAAIMLGRLR